MASAGLVVALLVTAVLCLAQGQRPSSSPLIASGGGIATRGTCKAMQGIAEGLNGLGKFGQCRRGDDCTFVECIGDSDIKLSIVPCCQGNHVTAVQLQIKHQGKVYVDQVFGETNTVRVTIEGQTTVISVILNYINGDLHLQVDVTEGSEQFTAIPSTQVPYDSQCNGENAHTARCNAIADIVADLDDYNCLDNSNCDYLDCYNDLDDDLMITLLPCMDPQAVKIEFEGVLMSFHHIFSDSDTIFVNVKDVGTIGVAVTLNHLGNDRIGLQMDLIDIDGTTLTAIPYTVIPLDTSDCSKDATCNAIASVIADLYTRDYYNCTHSSNCNEIDCHDEFDDLTITLLPCKDPQAVRIVNTGSVPFDHTFSKTETLFVNIKDVGTYGVAVTLDHLGNDRIGLEVDFVDCDTSYTLILYTVIPLDTSDCSEVNVGLIVGVSVGALVLLICCCAGICIVVCVVMVVRRRKRHGERIKFEAMRPVGDED